MKALFKIKAVSFLLFILCFGKNIQAQEPEPILDSMDIVFIESFADSVDIKSLKSLYEIAITELYHGNNDRGNRIINFVLSHIDEPSYELLHAISVQNLKNGNYAIAFDNLTKASALDNEVYGYFGWVMLYYFRDYDRALKYLDIYDSLTPNFSDAPVGENIDYLRGLAYLQLGQFQKAITYFDQYISETTLEAGEDWVEVSTFYYKGIALFEVDDFEKAKENFELAISYHSDFTESYYYLFLSLKTMQKSKEEYLPIIKKAKHLASQGRFRTDIYVSFFYPVSMEMIEKKCN
jgi:tetratricopeptide (TPR) repeat protein